jgi:hypothetical protein
VSERTRVGALHSLTLKGGSGIPVGKPTPHFTAVVFDRAAFGPAEAFSPS